MFAVNTNVTSRMPFVIPKHIYVCPLTEASYVVNSNILTYQAPFLCPKHIAICSTIGFIVAIKFML